MIALGATFIIYIVVVVTSLLTVDISSLANSKSPLVLAVESGRFASVAPMVRIGACFASIGVLLSLMAGVSRTAFAMAANKDLPVWFSKVHPIRKVPYRAELTVGLIVATFVSIADLRSAIGFSSFAILIYYAIANLSCWKLAPDQRLWPKWMCGVGLISCLTVSLSLPLASVVGGLLVFVFGYVVYHMSHRLRN